MSAPGILKFHHDDSQRESAEQVAKTMEMLQKRIPQDRSKLSSADLERTKALDALFAMAKTELSRSSYKADQLAQKTAEHQGLPESPVHNRRASGNRAG